ncbi:MAG: phosphatidate cytidylyltransferase, partial [Rhodothermales bacterium]
MSNLALRILTAVVGIPVVVGLMFLGGWPFALLVLGVALLSQYEIYVLLEAAGARPYGIPGLVLGAFVVLQAMHPPLIYAAVAAVLALLAWFPFEQAGYGLDEAPGPAGGLERMSATLFGVVYPAALLSLLLAIRNGRGPAVGEGEAFYLTLMVFLLVWSSDTCAYFAGRAIGKRPLAPRISPKKTWAGAVGGVLGAVAVGVVIKLAALEALSLMHVVLLGGIASVVGQLGDLAESRMKRLAG